MLVLLCVQTVKKTTYHHAPGAVYCLSHSMMMELEPFIKCVCMFVCACFLCVGYVLSIAAYYCLFSNMKKLNESCRFCGSDDLAIGFITGNSEIVKLYYLIRIYWTSCALIIRHDLICYLFVCGRCFIRL